MITSIPVCEEHPEHGAMQIEPMFGADGKILQYGWFCQIAECDGYGGPTPKPKSKDNETRNPTDSNRVQKSKRVWTQGQLAHSETVGK